MVTVSEFNDRKRREIALGQAKNQAVQIMKSFWLNIDDTEMRYKRLTKHFFKWNMELDEELIKDENNKAD